MPLRLALKVDVDTDRGTRIGVPNLVADCRTMGVPACFLFSLGPDQTGRAEFRRIFGMEARTAGAPGWQSNGRSRQVYDEARLLYASDTRDGLPFFPRINGRIYDTLEIPSTLPTFDELMGRPEFPDEKIVAHYLSLLRSDRVNVFTLHAEIEGMGRRTLFQALLQACRAAGVEFIRLDDYARELLEQRGSIRARDQIMMTIDGRSGLVAGSR